jgi:hypothetical protein
MEHYNAHDTLSFRVEQHLRYCLCHFMATVSMFNVAQHLIAGHVWNMKPRARLPKEVSIHVR